MGAKPNSPKHRPLTEAIRSYSLKAGVITSLGLFVFLSGPRFVLPWTAPLHVAGDTGDLCPQSGEIQPVKHHQLWKELGNLVEDTYFKSDAIGWLSGAVKIPTESYDEMGAVGEDIRWEVFGDLHQYLRTSFPTIHEQLEWETVNTYALLYTWRGSDPSLQPLLLTAHQDVVPVDPTTVSEWEHPPYSGYIDGERVWGRGSDDDKSGLIGIMTAVESLLLRNFSPRRTVVLAFGIDEESSGMEGAFQLNVAMLDKFGEKSMAMLVDEGNGYGEQHGATFAIPAVAEKGYLDMRVAVVSPGGHSSIPPPHTSIGMLSRLLVEIEGHPFPAHLSRSSPIYDTLKCYAAHGPELASDVKALILRSTVSDKALGELEKRLFHDSSEFKSLVGTTQAIDLVGGGIKTNALPEEAWAVVNHRIAIDSSVAEVQAHHHDLLADLASSFNLSFTSFGNNASIPPSYGSLVLTDAWDTALEPAPTTPTGLNAAAYHLLSGTIKATFNAHNAVLLQNAEDIFVAPSVGGGNTDTQFYWKLTDNIFRYNHKRESAASGIHTVNEFVAIDAWIELVRFFQTLILNVDESDAI